jgi:hypothetical protein
MKGSQKFALAVYLSFCVWFNIWWIGRGFSTYSHASLDLELEILILVIVNIFWVVTVLRYAGEFIQEKVEYFINFLDKHL